MGVVFDETQLERMIVTLEEQIKLANSTDENLRKQTDLFWENTYVRGLLDGTGNNIASYIDIMHLIESVAELGFYNVPT